MQLLQRSGSGPRIGVTGILLGIGVVLRVAQYLFNRSLWYDEIHIGMNILERSYRGLLLPLSKAHAPLGFLMLEKVATNILGRGEYALRLVPLIAGLASLFLFRSIAVRMLSRRAVPVAVGLFVLCDPLIYFSSELKQYSSDVATSLVLLIAMWRTREGAPAWRPLALLALAGAVAIWFSHPSVFVLAGGGVTLGLGAMARRDTTRLRLLVLVGAVWIFSFALCYQLSLRTTAQDAGLLKFWDKAFLPLPPKSLADLLWGPRAILSMIQGPAGFEFPGLAVLALAAGCVAFLAADPERLALLLAPLPLALLASGLHKYPFSGRLLLFLVPSILLLVGEGVEYVRQTSGGRGRIVGATLLVMLLLPPALNAGRHLFAPRTREEIKPVLAHIREKLRSGDRLYVYWYARPAFDYYSAQFGLSTLDATTGAGRSRDWNDYRRELDTLRGPRRTWVLFSHVIKSGGAEDEEIFLCFLDGMGRRLDEVHAPGAAAYLYDLGK